MTFFVFATIWFALVLVGVIGAYLTDCYNVHSAWYFKHIDDGDGVLLSDVEDVMMGFALAPMLVGIVVVNAIMFTLELNKEIA